MMVNIQTIKEQFQGLSSQEILQYLGREYAASAVFSTSFGLEDQVITHQIFDQDLPLGVFTLDTGRLFPETYSVWSRTLDKYKKTINTVYPAHESVEKLVSEKGPNSFYTSLENRLECCSVRKIEPLQRALAGKRVWITGIRQQQSANRKTMDWVEWDETHQLIKVHPLFYWTQEEVQGYIRKHQIPFNSLHDKGFPSIGCAPCTRAVPAGGDSRDGRWWWEGQTKKECGLHITQNR